MVIKMIEERTQEKTQERAPINGNGNGAQTQVQTLPNLPQEGLQYSILMFGSRSRSVRLELEYEVGDRAKVILRVDVDYEGVAIEKYIIYGFESHLIKKLMITNNKIGKILIRNIKRLVKNPNGNSLRTLVNMINDLVSVVA